jgi:hypothetical protein
MALFKLFRGPSADLPTSGDLLKDGYAFFCTDDGKFVINYKDGVDEEGNDIIKQKRVNASELDSIAQELENLGLDIEEIKAAMAAQTDWDQSDDTAVDFIKNKPFYTSRKEINCQLSTDITVDNYHWYFLSDEANLPLDTTLIQIEYWNWGYTDENAWHPITQEAREITLDEAISQNIVKWDSSGVDSLGNTIPVGWYGTVVGQFGASGNVVRSLSSVIEFVKQLDEKYISNNNLTNGKNKGSLQQAQDQESGVTAGYFKFTDKNPNATALDNSLTGEIKYGATGDYASAFGGKSAAMGKRSHAEGTTTIAKGKYSHAEGDNAVTLGDDSHAEGYQTLAFGKGSHAEGGITQALGEFSHTENYMTKAEGPYSHAEGEFTKAIGKGSHAEGRSSQATASYTHAEGENTFAGYKSGVSEGTADGAHAEGYRTQSVGNAAHAEGYLTIAGGTGSHSGGVQTQALGHASFAMGYETIASQDNQFVIGLFNRNNADNLFEIGNGTSDTHRVNIFEVRKDGRAKVYGAPVDADDILRLGDPNIQNGEEAYSLKQKSASVASGYASIALGTSTTASGNGAIATGTGTTASGERSYAGGNACEATSFDAFAIGFQTKATSLRAFAEGASTLASGTNSHASGSQTTATGDDSYSTGHWTNAGGDAAFSAGFLTNANYDMQFSVGHCNENLVDNIFEIGNGYPWYQDGVPLDFHLIPENTIRFNAFEVSKEGEAKAEKFSTKSSIYNRATVNIYDENNQPIVVPGAIASGFQSVAFGGKRVDKISSSSAVPTEARGDQSFATGGGVIVNGAWSAGFGKDTKTFQKAAFACGGGTVAGDETADPTTYSFGFAAGESTKALGRASFAEGNGSIAQGPNSHAQGVSSQAIGNNSHAEGCKAIANGENSHAQGYDTRANGLVSFAAGVCTVAGYNHQTVIGRFNDNKSDTLFEIGNGDGTSHDHKYPSNAFEVYSDGRVKSYVDLTTTTLEDNDLVTVACMKQYIKDNFATLLEEYFANNQVTFDGGDAGSHEPIAIVGETTLV